MGDKWQKCSDHSDLRACNKSIETQLETSHIFRATKLSLAEGSVALKLKQSLFTQMVSFIPVEVKIGQ